MQRASDHFPVHRVLLSAVEIPAGHERITDAAGRSCLNIQSSWTLHQGPGPGYTPSSEVWKPGSGRPGSACGMPAALCPGHRRALPRWGRTVVPSRA